MGHPAREPPNVRPTGRRWVHLSRRANAAPPIRSRPLGKGLLETGAGMGQQGALYAGTRAIFHEALVATLESNHPQSSIRNNAKGGYIIAPDANADWADEQLAKYPNNYRWTFDSIGKRRRI